MISSLLRLCSSTNSLAFVKSNSFGYHKSEISNEVLPIIEASIISPDFNLKNISVEELKIIGNDHTRDFIIEREIHHLLPGEFDSTLVKKDRDRIYNLGLFSTVEIYQTDSIYNVLVIETFPFLPIPIVDYEEGKGFSYGAGIAYLNFRGLNEQLIFGGIKGEETIYFFDFNLHQRLNFFGLCV